MDAHHCHSERLRRIFSAGRTYAKESGAGSSGGSARSHLRQAPRLHLPRDSSLPSFAQNYTEEVDAAPFRARSGLSQQRRYFEMV